MADKKKPSNRRDYFRKYREANHEKLRKYNREYARKRRAAQRRNNGLEYEDMGRKEQR